MNEIHQHELFHDTWENALQATVIALGGFKKVAAELWPGMNMDSAYSKLKACLNEEKEREKLSFSEILTITKWGRDKGIHYSNAFFNDETGYQRPEPLNPESESAKLMREYIEAAQLLKRISQKIEKNKIQAVG